MYDLAIVIGRFQPFHLGHLALVEHARSLSPHLCIVLGSQGMAPNIDNPWSVSQRVRFIQSCIGTGWTALGIPDSDYAPELWAKDLKEKIARAFPNAGSIVLVGHEKDDSSYYLGLFPEWELSLIPIQARGLSGTKVRRALFTRNYEHLTQYLPKATTPLVWPWLSSPEGMAMTREFEALELWRQTEGKVSRRWGALHLVILSRKRVLVLRRDDAPGYEQMALPGPLAVVLPGKPEKHGLALAREYFSEQSGVDLGEAQGYPEPEGPWIFKASKRDPRGALPAYVWFYNLGSKTLDLPRSGKRTKWLDGTNPDSWNEAICLDHGRIIGHILRAKGIRQ